MMYQKLFFTLFTLVFCTVTFKSFSQSAAPSNNNSYTIKEKSTTSAGVYKADGTLVRTLWSGVVKEAGTYEVVWDGTNDFQEAIPKDNYIIKVMSSNMQYTWQGVIGNSSANQVGPNIHRSLDAPDNIVIAGANAYYTVGYDERTPSHFQFSLDNPQVKLDPFTGFVNQTTDYACTDGENIYWTGWDNYDEANSWVYATKVSDNSLVIFPNGVTHKVRHGKEFASVIDLKRVRAKPSGITVSSDYLFVSYQGLGYISVINKTTGALVQTLNFPSPTAIAANGNTLWLCTRVNSVEKYNINSDGTLSSTGVKATGFTAPITMNTNGRLVGVVDGGSSQQLKAIDFNNGSLLWSFGQSGGNLTSPVVSNDRFGFWKRDQETSEKVPHGGFAFAPDGSFWVCDVANFRMQHYASDRTFIERIQYTGRAYNLAVDLRNPTKVLNTVQEYQVDYTSPIKNSWVHKYNWDGNFKPEYDLLYKIRHMCTLSNGRTYAMMVRKSGGAEMVELDPAIGIRYTGLVFETTAKIYEDGSIGEMQNGAVNETQYFKKRTLVGFNGVNPIYSSAKLIATHSNTSTNEPRNGSISIYPTEITSTGILTLYKGNRVKNEVNSYHLGGFDIATGKVKWKTALPTFDAYEGAFPNNGDFEVGNFGSENGGQGDAAMAIGRSIITHYYGEFWKAGQTNIFNHYYDNGLFVGQFGTTSDDVTQTADAKMAGNAFSPVIVQLGEDYYLYHNDESHHGGTHRWKITGLNTIQEQAIPISNSFVRTDEAPALPGIDLMAGLPNNSTLPGNTGGWSRNPSGDATGWTAKTNVKTYSKRSSPDLYITYSQNSGAYNVSRDLGTNVGLNSWELTGKVSYDNSMPNTSIGVFLDVLDNNGKIITRFYNSIDYSASPVKINLYANNTLIGAGIEALMKNITKQFQQLSISMTGGSMSVSYAGYQPVKVGSYDATANPGSPKTLRLYFVNSGGPAFGKTLGLDKFRFISSNGSSTTPSSPILAADDAANTLAASHALGKTEILVSENGGPFAEYNNEINVGDVARPEGFWKFKTKGSIQRNESAVVNSPEFFKSFTSQCSATGSILYEVWNNVGGTNILNNNWSSNPSKSNPLTSFEAPRNLTDNFAARIRGYICPPQTGYYTFWIAGDDATELWLST
ncbi:PA14 domain-containing protein, partial [Segetibacter aerophilus]|uniref:PA14 domain-containing protein n=1 Tax=Segetibacter aerophilus TaxID=670293 RepID=UPI001C3F62CE